MCSNWCTLYLHIVRTSFFAKLIKLAFGLKVSGGRNGSVMINNWFFKENKTKHASFSFFFIVFLILFQECCLVGNTNPKIHEYHILNWPFTFPLQNLGTIFFTFLRGRTQKSEVMTALFSARAWPLLKGSPVVIYI